MTEFVAHMNPLGVLTAEDVMTPLQGTASGQGIDPKTPLREVMLALQAAGDTALIVQDAQGRPLGRITSAAVLDSLLDPRGKRASAG